MGDDRRAWRVAIVAGLASWVVLALTTRQLPLVWDEGEYLLRADQIIGWFGLIVHGPSRLQAFSTSTITQHWWYIDQLEGHPSWSGLCIALTKALFGGFLNPLTAARLGPITLFATACAAVSFRVTLEYGTAAAIVTPIALLTLPRLFSDAHFAALDGQLTAWWLLVWVADASQRRSVAKAVAVGVLVGFACATKFTGWFALVPLVGWRVLRRDRDALRELAVILPVTLLTFFAINPPLWHAPIAGFETHVRLNLGRHDTHLLNVGAPSSAPIDLRNYLVGPLQYGTQHPYLPWYNTIAWLALATPLPTLILGAIGFRWCRSIALRLHWATLMVVRALPGMPPNDGIRHILPAFGFWCVLAGIGAQRVWTLPHADGALRLWVRAALAAALAAGAINVARYYPQTLSHFSVLVGGVRGAAHLGIEPTYWWDALDDEVLEWIDAHAEANAAVAFSWIPDYNVALLQSWNRLRAQQSWPALPKTLETAAGTAFSRSAS